MKTRFYLYRQKHGVVAEWYFDDSFDTYNDAYQTAIRNAENAIWKVWKIEEVLVYE